MRSCSTLAALLSILLLTTTAMAVEPAAPSLERLQDAIPRAIAPIQASLIEYPSHRDCFTCHNQAMPVFALTLARDHGFPIDPEALAAARDVTLADLEGAREGYRKGQGQGGGATRAGYALLTLELLEYPADATTAAVTGYLLQRDAQRGYWHTSSNRPPSESSDFTTSYVALRALQSFPPAEQEARVRMRFDRARDWLRTAPTTETEDRVFRLLALPLTEADAATISQAVAELKAHQNADGGWSQIPGRPSDAYATGSALVALQVGGQLPTNDPAYRRGLAFLLANQLEDGTWHVKSRSKPFQPYFESGFPHGPDQFLSIAASSWATAALVLACPTGTSP